MPTRLVDLEEGLRIRAPYICFASSLKEEPAVVIGVVTRVRMHAVGSESSLEDPHEFNFDSLLVDVPHNAFEVFSLGELHAQHIDSKLYEHVCRLSQYYVVSIPNIRDSDAEPHCTNLHEILIMKPNERALFNFASLLRRDSELLIESVLDQHFPIICLQSLIRDAARWRKRIVVRPR